MSTAPKRLDSEETECEQLSVIPNKVIQTEIARRESLKQQTASAQETFENELEGKRRFLANILGAIELEEPYDELEKARLERDIAELEQHVESCRSGLETNGRALAHLLQYRSAVATIRAGLPQGALSK